MKKIMICLFPIVLMAIGMVSCEKEELAGGKIRVRLERCRNIDSKVSFDMTDGFRWQSGDQIKICRQRTASAQGIATYTIDAASVNNQENYAVFSYTDGTDITTGSYRNYYYIAYYPASIRGTATALSNNVKIIIPNTQTIASDGKMQEFPMYSELSKDATSLDFSFKNLCGILRLHLTGSEGDMVSSITITTDETHPIAGTFKMEDEPQYITTTQVGTSVGNAKYSITVNCPSSGLDISAGRDFCIYLPTGNYPHMEITITRTDGKECKRVFDGGGSKDAPTAINIARSCYTSVTFDNLMFKTVLAFSVSATRTVVFSTGNLQYDITNSQYQFAGNDYTYIGEDNYTNLNAGSGVIDLFGWGTGDNPTLNSSDVEDYPTTFVDWGDNQIRSSDGTTTYAAGTWRTLTATEWDYLLKTRSATTIGSVVARYAKAKVCNV